MAEPTLATAQAAPTTFTSAPSLAVFRQPQRVILEGRPEYDGLAVGACVFDPTARDNDDGADDGGKPKGRDRILLVQRAATDSMPLLWEVPGGACDAEDESLLHAVARELWEESGLRARAVRTLVAPPPGGRYQGRDDGSRAELGGGGGLADVFFTRRGKRGKFYLRPPWSPDGYCR